MSKAAPAKTAPTTAAVATAAIEGLVHGNATGVALRGTRAGAGGVGAQHVFQRRAIGLLHERAREDVGGDGEFAELRVEAGDRVRVERAVAFVGGGLDDEGAELDGAGGRGVGGGGCGCN